MKQDNLEVSKLDATAISRLDSAGALFLQRLISYFESGGRAVELVGLQPRYRQLVDFIRQGGNKISVEKRVFVLPNWFYQIGSAVAAFGIAVELFLLLLASWWSRFSCWLIFVSSISNSVQSLVRCAVAVVYSCLRD